jgi:hypothetical protein
MPQLHTLIRIRKSTVQALCAWDLQDMRPRELTVLDTRHNLTEKTRQEAIEIVSA